jgi:hypothetical protein
MFSFCGNRLPRVAGGMPGSRPTVASELHANTLMGKEKTMKALCCAIAAHAF